MNPLTTTCTTRGLTLVEFMLALGITTVLLLAMGGAVSVAARALPHEAGHPSIEGAAVVSELNTDLRLATRFEDGRNARSVTFTVPDRDGNRVAELVTYEWSGVVGDPLIRTTNGDAAVTIASNVHAFEMNYTETTLAGSGGTDESGASGHLNVLYVVSRDDDPRPSELIQQFLFESWNYGVTLIDDEALPAAFDEAFGLHDVVLVSSHTNRDKVGTKTTTAPIGVVTANRDTVPYLDLAEDKFEGQAGTSLIVEDNTHYITQPFFPGLLPITTDNEDLLHGNEAPRGSSALLLGSEPGRPERLMLLTLERGATQYSGSPAAGRRVVLPWGDNFDASRLNDSGRTLLRRALEWAAEREATDEVSSPLFSQDEDPSATDKFHTVAWDDWAAASIVPALPADATGWKVSHFRFRAKQKAAADRTLVFQVRRRMAGGEPGSEVLGQTYLPESSLPLEYDWVEVTFDLDEWIAPEEGACITIGLLSGSDGGSVWYEEGMGSTTPANQFYKGTVGDWQTNDNRDIPCEVDGPVQMPLE